MKNIYLELKESSDAYKKRIAVGWKSNKRWQTYSYQQLFEIVDNLSSGLVGLGLKSKDRVVIFSENRPEWLISDLAINQLGAISVPIHTTANKSLLDYIVSDSGSDFLIASQDLFEKFKDDIISYKKKVILMGQENDGVENVVLFDSLINKRVGEFSVVEADKENLASIIYTSGTTGEPKGVMLTNNNILSNIRAIKNMIEVKPSDKLLSFLPLSHIFERTVGSYTPLFSGASIYYAENIKKISENLVEIKPTIIVGVPKIFERVYEKIFANIKSKNFVLRKFFFWSLKRKKGSYSKKFADILIYSKIRKSFGGNLRFAVSGGASINERILRFFRNIGIVITEGYGLTETSPVVAANCLDGIKIGTVGRMPTGVEIKIGENKEVLVKGACVMKGYYNKPELTKEAFTEDGWFRTGDQGFLDHDNYLTIIGRQKDIIVTSNGKNVAPEKIEGIINLSPFVEQCLVVGHKMPYLSALIIPSEKAIKDFFRSKKQVYNLNMKEKMIDLIQKEIDSVNQKLEHHERIKNFKLLDNPFTIEAGELTPTLKVRRMIIISKKKKIIDEMYKKG